MRPVDNRAEGPHIYATRDKKYTITAITITTSKFGPSGSLKNAKSVLEHTIAVSPRSINEIFFDLKYIFVIILVLFALYCEFDDFFELFCIDIRKFFDIEATSPFSVFTKFHKRLVSFFIPFQFALGKSENF